MALRTEGIRVRRGALSVTFVAEDSAGASRVAYAIGRRVGTAVVRNRLRRRLRAIVADLARSRPDLLPGGALVISAGADASGRNPDELKSDVVRLLDALRTRRHPKAVVS
jgi:ribonuclease P protein component